MLGVLMTLETLSLCFTLIFSHYPSGRRGSLIPKDFQVLGHVAVPRLSDAFSILSSFSHGLKSPRLFAFGFASFRRFFYSSSFSNGLKSPRLFAFGFASFRRFFYSFLLFPRVQEPAAIRLWLRVFQTLLAHHSSLTSHHSLLVTHCSSLFVGGCRGYRGATPHVTLHRLPR